MYDQKYPIELGEAPYQNATQITSYILFGYASSITNEGLQTNLVTCHLFPVVMTSFNTAASLLLSRATHKHASNNLPHPVQDKLPH